MAIIPNKLESQRKISFPRRLATYLTSMNLSKVFRRHPPKETFSSLTPKTPDRPSNIDQHHHRYPRPFSYHIPPSEQTLSTIPYRIGLSSDSTLLTPISNLDTDDIVRLPAKGVREHLSPRARKDRRAQSQLNANKRWLYRSMETLDGWKGKVFPTKVRTTNSSPSRSRSVENLAEQRFNGQSPIKQQRARLPHRSIEALTHRVFNGIGIHRKSIPSMSTEIRSPGLTIQKQNLQTSSKGSPNRNGFNPSTILDFREISSTDFLNSQPRMQDDQEIISSINSENRIEDFDSSNQELTDMQSHGGSFIANVEDEATDSWDFSITWIDSLKEQSSPQRKIQFYENLIRLLEQDTLSIDELLVLRKVLAKIWPADDQNDENSKTLKPSRLTNSKAIQTKIPLISQHTAQRCTTVHEQSASILSNYEALHDQNSGHTTKPSSLLISAKAKPFLVQEHSNQHYPSHLNPFQDDNDVRPSAPVQETHTQNNDSIRRYFERLTLLETIYEKLNIESTKTTTETKSTHHVRASRQVEPIDPETQRIHSTPIPIEIQKENNKTLISPVIKPLETKKVSNRFIEMNVDGNGSISSGKSSLKRRAPTAPHLHQPHRSPSRNQTPFTLSSADLTLSNGPDSQQTLPIRWTPDAIARSMNDLQKDYRSPSKVSPPPPATASCDDNGQIFVDNTVQGNQNTDQDRPSHLNLTSPKAERIQQWLSNCSPHEDPKLQTHRLLSNEEQNPSTQLKLRCVAKPTRSPSVSPSSYPEKTRPFAQIDIEPGRFRTSLKIQLDTHESNNHHGNSPTRYPTPTNSNTMTTTTTTAIDNFPRNQQNYLSHFQEDHQAVYL